MRRAILKALTWRCVATSITAGLTYYVTGSIDTAIHVGAIDTVIKLGAYVAHEKAWRS